MKIGIFDSGIGGVNVLKELIKTYPNNHYIYYGDTKNVPYGNKTKDELLTLSKKIIHFFEKKKVDLIIIACGTISSNCYLELINETKIKIYDIISPTIDFINNSDYQKIGLIGTTKTIESNIFSNKIKNKQVLSKDTPLFVPIIENNQIQDNEKIITSELSIFKNKVDCLILGCTHYPLIKEVISKYLSIHLIDMGVILAKKINLSKEQGQKIELYFSSLNDEIKYNVNKILNQENVTIKLIK